MLQKLFASYMASSYPWLGLAAAGGTSFLGGYVLTWSTYQARALFQKISLGVTADAVHQKRLQNCCLVADEAIIKLKDGDTDVGAYPYPLAINPLQDKPIPASGSSCVIVLTGGRQLRFSRS